MKCAPLPCGNVFRYCSLNKNFKKKKKIQNTKFCACIENYLHRETNGPNGLKLIQHFTYRKFLRDEAERELPIELKKKE